MVNQLLEQQGKLSLHAPQRMEQTFSLLRAQIPFLLVLMDTLSRRTDEWCQEQAKHGTPRSVAGGADHRLY